MLERCDAALLIGDPALKIRLEEYDTIDLSGSMGPVATEALSSVLSGPAEPQFICPRTDFHFSGSQGMGPAETGGNCFCLFARSLNLPMPFLEEYLRQNIDYDLGAGHIGGVAAIL